MGESRGGAHLYGASKELEMLKPYFELVVRLKREEEGSQSYLIFVTGTTGGEISDFFT